MVDKGLLEQYRKASNDLAGKAKDAVQSIVSNLDLTSPEAARNALLEFIPTLTDRFGSVSASLAAEWYEEARRASGASSPFRATTAASVPREAVAAQTRFVAGHLWTPDPKGIIPLLLTSVDKYVKQPARDTITANANREGVRWARVPSGAKTCSFCLMVASRDAIYLTRRSAGGDGSRYHGLCDCVPTRIGPKDEYPEGYLPDNYYEMYSTARDEAGSGNLNDITAAFRRTFPDAVTDGVSTQ